MMKKFFRSLISIIAAASMLFAFACAPIDDGVEPPSEPPVVTPEQPSGGSGEQKPEQKPEDKPEEKPRPEPGQPEIKNVIIMIGDGMGKVHEEAGRILKGGALAWDDFDYIGDAVTRSLTTRDDPTSPTDSAAAATALATGEKVFNSSIALTSGGQAITNIMEIAHANNKRTGVVTSDSLAGATPSGFSAHAPDRNATAEIISSQVNCPLDLLIGEGAADYTPHKSEFNSKGFFFTNNIAELDSASSSRIVASFDSIEPESENVSGSVRLRDLAEFALDYLSRDEDGFCLMIEGAKIDKRSHASNFPSMLNELMDFDEVVSAVADWVRARDDTYLIVTADHETGGLRLKNAVNKSNLTRPSSYEWTTPGVHSVADVHYHALGAPSVHHRARIENTTIFRTLKEFVTGEPTEGSDIVDRELRIAGKAYTVDSIPEVLDIGGGTITMNYDAEAERLDMKIDGVSLTSPEYSLYTWQLDVAMELVGNNSFRRSSGRTVSLTGGSSAYITGTGRLNVTGDFYVYGDLVAAGGELKVIGSAQRDAVYVAGEVKICPSASVTVYNNSDDEHVGIKSTGLTVTGGKLTVDGFKYGIFAAGNVNIMGGEVELKSSSECAIYSDVTVTMVVNSGLLVISGDQYGIMLNGDASRLDICRDDMPGVGKPRITMNTGSGALRTFYIDILGGTVDITVGDRDAVRAYSYLTTENCAVSISRKDNAQTKTGLLVPAGATAEIKNGTSLTIIGFHYGILQETGGNYIQRSGATVAFSDNKVNKQLG